jgi:hypothetical protein
MLWASPNPYLRLNEPEPSLFPSRSAGPNNFSAGLLRLSFAGSASHALVAARRVDVNAASLAKVPRHSKN